MKKLWHYPQIIDLEFLVHLDENENEERLASRDRAIYLNAPEKDSSTSNRQELLQLWLNKRLSDTFAPNGPPSPGNLFGSALQLTTVSLLLLGLLSGLGAGFSFFAYTGTTPVNVFHFLLLFVGSQFILTLLLLAGLLLRRLKADMPLPTLYNYLLKPLLARLAAYLARKSSSHLPAKYRLAMHRALGLIRVNNSVYGKLFYWLFFSRAQLFGIALNVGLLAATFLKLLTSDLAFGWQSTLPFTAEAIHKLVNAAATPWSWLVGANLATPSLTQIEGSRIILKEGIENLATPDLVAWWPFLIGALIAYGLIVRIVLYLAGKAGEKVAINGLQFDTPRWLAIIRRMTTPQVTTQAPIEKIKVDAKTTVPQPVTPLEPLPGASPQIVLVPEDIKESWPPQAFNTILSARQMELKERYPFMGDYDADEQLANRLGERQWQEGDGLFLLLEGWMPPLTASISYLKLLRSKLPKQQIITVGLVGKPQDGGHEPLREQDLAIWKAKIAGLADSYLDLFPISQEGAEDDS